MSMLGTVPSGSTGIQLHRVHREELLSSEPVQFDKGTAAVYTVLRRAAISGRVHIGGEIGDFLADLHDREGNLLETVALDRESYRALKHRWMRCRLLKPCG